MARCETCGNDYDKAIQVSMNGAKSQPRSPVSQRGSFFRITSIRR